VDELKSGKSSDELIAKPPQASELRTALPVLLELWSECVGGTMEVRLGFGRSG
jgi:hypothetical protein